MKWLVGIVFSLFFIFQITVCLGAEDVGLAWDSNTESDILGYRVWQAPESGGYLTWVKEVPHVWGTDTQTVMLEDVPSGTWYWVVTAYNTEGNGSHYSNEVSTEVDGEPLDTIPPAPPTGTRITDIQLLLGSTIFLDADTPATGSNLDTEPLVTAFGSITFAGEIVSNYHDPDMVAVGSLGAVFDVFGSAELFFDFDVFSVSFIYGGNVGGFNIEARCINEEVIDSFSQTDTSDGEPAGPITLTGPNIRSLYWQDPRGSFAPIDNITAKIQ